MFEWSVSSDMQVTKQHKQQQKTVSHSLRIHNHKIHVAFISSSLSPTPTPLPSSLSSTITTTKNCFFQNH